jgi:ABC-type oligopeptide transport system ATPase subunit
MMSDDTNTPLIDINGLTVEYVSHSGLLGRNKQAVRVLNDLDLQILPHETLGIVGESGCGKSTLGYAIIRLIAPTAGEVIYRDMDVLKLDKKGRRQLRRHMQLVFQNPHASLNPRMTIVDLVAEPLRTHASDMSRSEMKKRVDELLLEVGLDPEYKSRYPHQLSGGQAQRVVVARALALKPAFIVLDEPTSALDVSVQAQIINLLVHLQKEHDLTYMFISHDLGVVQHISDRIAVMYLGEIVELATSEDIFAAPKHPYTQALLSATLSICL